MSHSSQKFDLDASSRVAIVVQDGMIIDANPLARKSMPDLKPGTPVPDELNFPQLEIPASGSVVLGGIQYECYCSPSPDGQIISLAPEKQTALNDAQLARIIMERRQHIGDLLLNIGDFLDAEETEKTPFPQSGKAALKRYIHREMRQIEFMQDLSQQNRETPFQKPSERINLKQLCHDVVERSKPILKDIGITLSFDYNSDCSMCMISADSTQLKRVLFELIANAIQEINQGTIYLKLSRYKGFGSCSEKLCLTIRNAKNPSNSEKNTVRVPLSFPTAEAGAGMGLPIVQKIVQQNQGTLMKSNTGPCFSVFLSFPISQGGGFPVHSPGFLDPNGFSTLLVGLSEVLPDRFFESAGMG